MHRWRKRFCQQRLNGLADQQRSGRPPVFTASVKAEIKALACDLPATTQVPLSRWSAQELARELVLRGVVAFISAATIWRTLRCDVIKAWQYRSWIFSRDPNFATKAARVLDLYARIFEGCPLGDDEYVISSDELCEASHNCYSLYLNR